MEPKDKILKWLNGINFLEELSYYIELPSRSRLREEVKVAGDFAISLMQKAGLESRALATEGNPVIFGSNNQRENKPTILIYGHYDVQPEGNLDEWDSPPFKAIVRDGKLWGRGSADNKGQHYAHLLALRYLKEERPDIFNNVNVKFILDGDEELGSFSLPKFVEENRNLLDADFVLVSDGPSLVSDAPTIVGGVRGIVSFQISIIHNTTDLHSGNFGGIARSATLDLMLILNSMVDKNGKVLVNGFYDNIVSPSEFENSALDDLHPIYQQIMDDRGITPSLRPEGHSHQFLNEAWPTLNINGLRAGGVKAERRTIIPSEAVASIDCRLVWKQDPEDLTQKLKDHIQQISSSLGISSNVHLEFEGTMSPPPSSLVADEVSIVREALSEGFGKRPVLVPRLGGSLPIELFPRILKKPVILVPYALPDENNHAPNENLDLEFFKSGFISSIYLFEKLVNSDA